MKKYRERPLEFHSNFDMDDIMSAENILFDYGVEREKLQDCLADVCRRIFDLEIYAEDDCEYLGDIPPEKITEEEFQEEFGE